MIRVIYRKKTWSNKFKPDSDEKKLIKEGYKLKETNNDGLFFKYEKIWEKEYGQIKEKGDL